MLLLLFQTLFWSSAMAQTTKTGQWTWVDGDSTAWQAPFYGSKGIGSKRTTPGSRSGGVSWTDEDGIFWLFGGRSNVISRIEPPAYHNDLWKREGTEWIWVAGDSTSNSLGFTKGIGLEDTKNTPSAREHTSSAYRNGTLYLFGGQGISQDEKTSLLHDFWKLERGRWVWLSGTFLDFDQQPSPVFGTKGVAAAANQPGSRVEGMAWIDKAGVFWMFGGHGRGKRTLASRLNDMWKWDGVNWIWMAGSDDAYAKTIYGQKGVSSPDNTPGGRQYAQSWTDEEGNLILFGGFGEVGKSGFTSSGLLNDMWQWDGTHWTWIYGDSTANVQTEYYAQGVVSPLNKMGARGQATIAQDSHHDVWLFGGYATGSGSASGIRSNDLWRWDGKYWTWIHGDEQDTYQGNYGKKGEASDTTIPMGRLSAASWIDTEGAIWVFGGSSYEAGSSILADLCRFDPPKFGAMQVLGKGLVIADGDDEPSQADGSHLGAAALNGRPQRKTFVIESVVTSELWLQGAPIVQLPDSKGDFRVIRQPSQAQLGIGDTAHFVIEFAPMALGLSETEAVIFSDDVFDQKYTFIIAGKGIENRVKITEGPSCSEVQVSIQDQQMDHYTVLVYDRGMITFPVNGANYNFSPDYQKAPLLHRKARIIYQGPEREVQITGLVSGRTYQLLLVPGNGLPGNTVYYQDSASILYFKTPGSPWQDSLAVSPSVDTGACFTDILSFSGTSPFALKWMDGVEEETRILHQPDAFYFLTTDADNCRLSSDTVDLTLYLVPLIQGLGSSRKPWCLGDTVKLSARPSHPSVWSNGSLGDNASVTESGTYYITSTSEYGCSATDSISVQFGTYPTGRFLKDTFQSVGDQLSVSYEADGDSVFFVFNGQATGENDQLLVSDTGQLYLIVNNNSGCAVYDQAFVQRRELVLRAFPNAFSPNGDGLNDTWFFIHEADSGKLTIFDRWGEVIHSGSTTWDGTVRGEVVPLGTYFFIYEPYGSDQNTVMGPIEVIR